MVLEKACQSSWESEQIKLVNPKRNQPRIFIRTDAQYFGPLMRRSNSLEKALMLGKIEDRRRRGNQGMRRLDGISTDLL